MNKCYIKYFYNHKNNVEITFKYLSLVVYTNYTMYELPIDNYNIKI